MNNEDFSGPNFFGWHPGGLGEKLQEFFLVIENAFEAFFSGTGGAVLKFLLILIAVGATVLIIYFYLRIEAIEKKEREAIRQAIEEWKVKQEETRSQSAWERIASYLETGNEPEWKLGILEADNLLDQLFGELGYVGEGVGDKLKTADPAHVKNLDAAWEAHKIRNRVAHEGSAFRLNYREARRVLALYEQVFREFGYI